MTDKITETATVVLSVNGNKHEINVAPDTPLLWALRDTLGLTGTKFGCGMSLCGACTVHINGQPTRACITPVSETLGKKITTIEGLTSTNTTPDSQNTLSNTTSTNLHPVQQAWINEQVAQCGFCQSGQIMSAVALLENNPEPTDQDIDAAMSGNICRCGSYQRIRNAIKAAARNIALQ